MPPNFTTRGPGPRPGGCTWAWPWFPRECRLGMSLGARQQQAAAALRCGWQNSHVREQELPVSAARRRSHSAEHRRCRQHPPPEASAVKRVLQSTGPAQRRGLQAANGSGQGPSEGAFCRGGPRPGPRRSGRAASRSATCLALNQAVRAQVRCNGAAVPQQSRDFCRWKGWSEELDTAKAPDRDQGRAGQGMKET